MREAATQVLNEVLGSMSGAVRAGSLLSGEEDLDGQRRAKGTEQRYGM